MGGPYSVLITGVYLACGVFIFLIGLTILRVGRAGAPTRAAALMLFFAGVGPLLSATGIIIEHTLREGAVVYQSMLESFEYLWEFYFPSLMLFALSFPRENAALSRFPVIGLVVFLPYIFHLAVMMFGGSMLDVAGRLEDVLPGARELTLGDRGVDMGAVENLIGTLGRLLERAHRNAFAIVNIIYSALALYLLWRNRRDLVNPRLAHQLRTVSIGIAVSVVCYTFTKVSMMTRAGLSEGASLALINFSLVASGGTIAYAVVRQQFLGIRHVARRAVLYSAVALVFAGLYVVVVRPVGDFVGQYSAAGRGAFETGFIVVAIMAFQPMLMRTEEVLERVLLKGSSDATRGFKKVADEVAAVSTIEELDRVLSRAFHDLLDASSTALVLAEPGADRPPLLALLEEIGEPVRVRDLLRLREDIARAETGRGAGAWRQRLRWRASGRPAASLRAALAEADDELGGGGGERFALYVPLFRGATCVGFIGLGEKIYGVAYSQEELGYLAVLATQVGAALHNIALLEENLERKLLEEELRIARKIQTQLLPGSPPSLQGFDLCATTVPSRYVGGDYYDFVVVEGRWLVLVVADVSGKGIPASILTATLQATVRSNADAQTDPERMMTRLNRLLYRNTSAAEFATLFYAVVDLETGRMRYANAGHDFPLVASNGGVSELGESGLVLGCVEDFDYTASECTLPETSALVVYTDGVTDSQASDGSSYGAVRLKRVLSEHVAGSARDICQSIVRDVRAFCTPEAQDDLTLMVLKRGG